VLLPAGVCNLCNGAVDFMLENDAEGRFRMAALQSTAGRTLLQSCDRRPDDISSIVLVEPDGHYVKSCVHLVPASKALLAPLTCHSLQYTFT
jgi:predicted DCC family thiol-disulfide oxidoreductase YuxK